MTPSTTQNDLALAGSDWSRKARVAPRNVITAFTGEKVAPLCPQIERNRYSIVCHDRPLKTVTMLYHPFIVNGRTVDIINRSLKKKKDPRFVSYSNGRVSSFIVASIIDNRFRLARERAIEPSRNDRLIRGYPPITTHPVIKL